MYIHIHMHNIAHTYIYIYIYIYVCMYIHVVYEMCMVVRTRAVATSLGVAHGGPELLDEGRVAAVRGVEHLIIITSL